LEGISCFFAATGNRRRHAEREAREFQEV